MEVTINMKEISQVNKSFVGRMEANIMLIDKIIELMLGENVARQMPDDILMKFYEKSQEKLRTEAEKNYCLQTIAAIKMIDVVIIVIRNGIVKQKQNVNLIVGMMTRITKMM